MQQVKIGGTTYTIMRGKTKIDGTGYTIFGGKTKVGGTAYAIDLGPVPSDYRRVKWIESTAKGSYIVLPFTTQEGLRVDFEVAFSSDFLTRSDAIYYNAWGYYYSSGYYNQVFSMYRASGTSSKPKAEFRCSNADSESTLNNLTVTADTLYEVSVTATGNYTSGSTTMTFNGQSTSATGRGLNAGGREMRLFTTSDFWATSNNYPGQGRIGRFTAYNSSNELLCDLWPCYRRSDGEPGFWDTVSETFLTNAGSGSLVAGATVIS